MLETVDPAAPTSTSTSFDAGPATAPVRAKSYVSRNEDEKVHWMGSIAFLAFHATPLLILFTGVTSTAVVLFFAMFWGRMFFITAGYHRYFAHRSYKLARVPQFLMAFGGTMAAQKGPLWWAGNHRDHHTWSDTDRDVHSPLKGFWWSHVGWILCRKYNPTPFERIKDFAKYPELRFLNKHDFIGPWFAGILCYLIGGWSGLVVGFFCSTIVLWHATFLVNSLAHVMGRRRFVTDDTSRNSAIIAFLTMGEGWHNNHHFYQASVRQGFFWWEYDPSFYILRALSWVGIVKDMKLPPERVLNAHRVADGNFDIGMFKAHLSKATEAVAATQARVGRKVHDGRTHASEVLVQRRESLDAAIGTRKDAIEEFVESALHSAEELAKVSRRGERDLGIADS